jgi:short-subunit dehydrogenase
MKKPKIIAITGASSGLGAALARHYAKAGQVLYLAGRDSARLAAVAQQCRGLKATVYETPLDVTDSEVVSAWLLRAEAQTPIDLVIANAGISAGTGIHGEGPDQLRRIFATNIDGVVNTIQPLLPAMMARRRGQIANMSSMAGIRALPSAPAYSASKACVRYLGEAWRGFLMKHGVEVSVICPGYIHTPMTEVNTFPMPMIMSAEKAALIISRGLEKNKARIAFPLAIYIPLWLISCLPPALTDPIFSRLPGKAAIPD